MFPKKPLLLHILLWGPIVGGILGFSGKPYDFDPVTFQNGDVTLSGRLYMPEGPGPFPAVVLVHGSGRGTVDDFGQYRKHFVNHGVMVLVYDKRGCGASSGNYRLADFDDLARDAVAALGVLEARDDVDAGRIGLLGVNQGGWIIMIADAVAGGVDFLVNVSGPGMSPGEQTGYDFKTMMEKDRYPAETVELAASLRLKILAYLIDRQNGDALRAEIAAALENRDFRRAYDDGYLKEWIEWVQEGGRLSPIDALEVDPWVRDYDFDPLPYYESTRAPAFVVYGGRDETVPVGDSVRRIEMAFERTGKFNSRVVVYPKANHGLRVKRQPAFIFSPVFPEDFLDTLVEWIKE